MSLGGTADRPPRNLPIAVRFALTMYDFDAVMFDLLEIRGEYIDDKRNFRKLQSFREDLEISYSFG